MQGSRVAVATALFAASVVASSAQAAPSNDAFAAPRTLTGSSGTLGAETAGATKELGEPNHAGNRGGASVWFRWTAPQTGTARFDTHGSDFDTLLAVYVGGSVRALAEVNANDDAALDQTSALTFTARAGTVYRIAVDGYHEFGSTRTGSITLSWNLVSIRPANDDFATAQALAGSSGSVSGTNQAAARELGEPRHGHAAFATGASVWFSWEAPAAGVAEVDTAGSAIDTVVAVYVGGSLGRLTRVAAGTYSVVDGAAVPTRLRFSVRSGTVYRIAIDGYDIRDDVGAVTVNWLLEPPARANDDFAAAAQLVGATGTTIDTNAGASTEAGEPVHADVELNGASVWYRWSAPETGRVTFDTSGSDFDTLLAVYTGATLEALTELVSQNDDEENGAGTSRVHVAAARGASYWIAVDGYFGATGNVVLSWSVDAGAPSVAAPHASVARNARVSGGTVPVTLGWTGRAAEGIARFELLERTGAAGTTRIPLARPDATSVSRLLRPGTRYQFRTHAYDRGGNPSGWAGSALVVSLAEETARAIEYAGVWRRQALAGASRGYVRHARTGGGAARMSFNGHDVAWVAPRGPNRGKAAVWVDGRRVATIDLYAPSFAPARVVFARSWRTPRAHRIEVRVPGTKNPRSIGTRVDVDAFVVLG